MEIIINKNTLIVKIHGEIKKKKVVGFVDFDSILENIRKKWEGKEDVNGEDIIKEFLYLYGEKEKNILFDVAKEARKKYLKFWDIDNELIEKDFDYSLSEGEKRKIEEIIKGSCNKSCEIVCQELEKNNLKDFAIIRGNFKRDYWFSCQDEMSNRGIGEYDNQSGHFWVLYGNRYIIDISLDQFNNWGWDEKPRKNDYFENNTYFYDSYEGVNVIDKKNSEFKNYKLL